MIDIGPNLTHVLLATGHFLKWLLEGAAFLVALGCLTLYLVIKFEG